MERNYMTSFNSEFETSANDYPVDGPYKDNHMCYYNEFSSGNVVSITLGNELNDDEIIDIKLFPYNDEYVYFWFRSSYMHANNAGEHVLVPKNKLKKAYKRYVCPFEGCSLLDYQCVPADHNIEERFSDEVELIKRLNFPYYNTVSRVTLKKFED